MLNGTPDVTRGLSLVSTSGAFGGAITNTLWVSLGIKNAGAWWSVRYTQAHEFVLSYQGCRPLTRACVLACARPRARGLALGYTLSPADAGSPHLLLPHSP